MWRTTDGRHGEFTVPPFVSLGKVGIFYDLSFKEEETGHYNIILL